MTNTPIANVVLATGKGTRMGSDLHKVLHPLAGRPMLGHLLDSPETLALRVALSSLGLGVIKLKSPFLP